MYPHRPLLKKALCKHRHNDTPPQGVLFTRYVFMAMQKGIPCVAPHDSAECSGRAALGRWEIISELTARSQAKLLLNARELLTVVGSLCFAVSINC